MNARLGVYVAAILRGTPVKRSAARNGSLRLRWCARHPLRFADRLRWASLESGIPSARFRAIVHVSQPEGEIA